MQRFLKVKLGRAFLADFYYSLYPLAPKKIFHHVLSISKNLLGYTVLPYIGISIISDFSDIYLLVNFLRPNHFLSKQWKCSQSFQPVFRV
jgi:hypothetical protein